MMKPSFRERFMAWWEGYELATGRPAPTKLKNRGHDVRYEQEEPHWETARLKLAQQVKS